MVVLRLYVALASRSPARQLCQWPDFTEQDRWQNLLEGPCGCMLCDVCGRGCLCDDASTGADDDHRYETADAPATP